jgi:4'-phosphopantetheinyl transferase
MVYRGAFNSDIAPVPLVRDLPCGVIEVWSASLDAPSALKEALVHHLSEDERQRAARYVFPRDRDRFVVGRSFLRLLLGRYLACRPDALRFEYGDHGKPALADGDAALRFNLAHADGLAVCALARGWDVGVDLERVRPLPDAQGVARSFFSLGEVTALENLPAPQRRRAFFDAWTRKEAFLKALGSGLARPLDSFEVTLTPGDPARLVWTLGDPAEAERFSLFSFEPRPGYVAALAVPSRPWEPRYLRWSWEGLFLPEGEA